MPINQLVGFCNQSRNKLGKCAECVQECQNNCNLCLQECHFGHGRTYDCNNMVYCYTCSYIYKYSSEIFHLFSVIKFNPFDSFNILNLGCGSCADLFGIDKFLTVQGRQIPVYYTGIDSNERWIPTQELILRIFPQYHINFVSSDIFDYLDGIEDNNNLDYNIVILQYILNEFNLHCRERIAEFITKFVSKIIDQLPERSTIIINDINHFDVRSIAARIFNEASKRNVVSQIGLRFRNPSSHTYGGNMHTNDGLIFQVPTEIEALYNIKRPCSSAQLFIYKTRNK